MGVHYVGDVHRETTELHKMFNYITDGKMKWEEMGPVYDKMFFGKDQYNFVAGTEEFKSTMKSYFPGEEAAIDAYVDLIYNTQKKQRFFFCRKILPIFYAPLQTMRKSGLQGNKTTLEVLQSLTKTKD
ncbi:MAG: hypothetical protein IPH78_14010 [Bacteroidetes bacterium]|nr:hypothetical protein [Bacteroidota bacterium]